MDKEKSETERPHKLRLDGRHSLYLTGVADVCSFDETAILIRLDGCLLSVDGEDLHILGLNTGGGEMTVEGKITGLNYLGEKSDSGKRDPSGKKNPIGRLFR